MNMLDDVNRFLENQLEEFLRSHPQLELQVLEENLQEQITKTTELLSELSLEEKKQQDAILATAQEIQRWHQRIQKAEQAHRQDLAEAAKEREAALLRQGNQQWGQMQVIQARFKQTQSLLEKIQIRQQEVRAKIRQAPPQQSSGYTPSTNTTSAASGWFNSSSATDPDLLEEQFKRWEMDEELETLKRNMKP
ncbi:MAG: TIGR04376 family protein [Acaryochloridaceae cyanobacterium SU_2_1]|nr:TIGR04376 family protein [Acaryochloridaceae cyanobacterium SU_2_1]NJM95382.1 TIGR04376 family protein [Acaryochloridaceae cyanobacterium CSU_5_19]